MGQCWAKQRKPRSSASSQKLEKTQDARAPAISVQSANGLQPADITLSTLSINDKHTQHISERETADIDIIDHPADNPAGPTIFWDRSRTDLRDQRRKSQPVHYVPDPSPLTTLKRSNSCSTIYLDSTVTQPNLKSTIKAVSLAIYFHIKNRTRRSYQPLDSPMDEYEQQMLANLEIFDEKAHPLSREALPLDYAVRNPEQKTIYRFIRTLFNQAQLNAECAIVTLVYLERLLTYADFDLTPANWKRVTLGAVMLASKVWDDQAVWNVDYCQIIKEASVEDMNALERQFLQILQFNTNVPSSIYAKYYFDLRGLAESNKLSFPLEPLSKEKAYKLEAMSNLFEDRLKETKASLRRSTSLDGFQTLSRSSKAIIP